MIRTAGKGSLSRLWPKLRGVLAYGAGPALGLASGPLLARAMGPEGRGQFAAIMQPLTLAGAIASIGIPAAATYFVARGDFRRKSVLIRSLCLTSIFATLAYAILVLYSDALSDAQGISRELLLAVWLLIYLLAIIQIMRGYLQGQGRWKVLDAERLAFALLRFVGVVILAAAAVSAAEGYALAALGAFVLAGFLLWWPEKRKVEASSEYLPVIPYRVLTSFSLSAALGTIAAVANNRVDQVLLPLMSSSVEVGYYAIAVTVAEVPLILGTLAARDALYESSRGKSPLEVIKGLRLYLAGALVLCLSLALFAPHYMTLLFGADFAGAVRGVQILCVGTMFACIAFTVTSIVSGAGKPAVSSLIPLSGLIVTGLGFWLMRGNMTSSMASIVAAISQITSAVVGIVILLVLRNRLRKAAPGASIEEDVEVGTK